MRSPPYPPGEGYGLKDLHEGLHQCLPLALGDCRIVHAPGKDLRLGQPGQILTTVAGKKNLRGEACIGDPQHLDRTSCGFVRDPGHEIAGDRIALVDHLGPNTTPLRLQGCHTCCNVCQIPPERGKPLKGGDGDAPDACGDVRANGNDDDLLLLVGLPESDGNGRPGITDRRAPADGLRDMEVAEGDIGSLFGEDVRPHAVERACQTVTDAVALDGDAACGKEMAGEDDGDPDLHLPLHQGGRGPDLMVVPCHSLADPGGLVSD